MFNFVAMLTTYLTLVKRCQEKSWQEKSLFLFQRGLIWRSHSFKKPKMFTKLKLMIWFDLFSLLKWLLMTNRRKIMWHSKKMLKNLMTIRRRCIWKLSWIHFLNDVILFESFTTNLISISQLCDQDLCVNFNQSKCIVFISTNNCYIWTPHENNQHLLYMMSNNDEIVLWH